MSSEISIEMTGGGKCPKGQIMRRGYTTRTGKHVNPGCIIAQSETGKKTSKILAKYLEKKEKMHELMREKFPKAASKKCSKGYIKREGYSKKSFKSHSKKGKVITVKGYDVAPGCIKSVTGKSSKGKRLITIMDKDVLGQFGYRDVKSTSQTVRHDALRKALKMIKPLSVYRRVIALATLNKDDKKLYKLLRDDAAWIKEQDIYVKSREQSAKKSAALEAKHRASKKSSRGSKKSSRRSSRRGSKKSSRGSRRGSRK